jgi:protein-S-isoprenylcysteine O-methyltransferase Ste14
VLRLRELPGSLFVVAQLALLALIAFGPRKLGPEWPGPLATTAIIAGVLMMLVAGGLALMGTAQLGRNLTPLPRPTPNATLIRTGAYRIVRHPIYSGLILAAFGWGLFVHGGLTLLYACALFGLLDAKSRYEERMLVARFDDYTDYKRQVCRLVPFLY